MVHASAFFRLLSILYAFMFQQLQISKLQVFNWTIATLANKEVLPVL